MLNYEIIVKAIERNMPAEGMHIVLINPSYGGSMLKIIMANRVYVINV